MVQIASGKTVLESQVVHGDDVRTLTAILQHHVELALWQRSTHVEFADLHQWLQTLPEHQLPACRLDAMQPADSVKALNASWNAGGTPQGDMRQALLADIAHLVRQFSFVVGCATVGLRLEAVTGDACRRWHRDCVPLRLITTYRGPGTDWVRPEQSAAVMAQPDEDVSDCERLAPFDVALFKGCGWAGNTHDAGIVHRSPRIAGKGITRLVLVLNPPSGFSGASAHEHRSSDMPAVPPRRNAMQPCKA